MPLTVNVGLSRKASRDRRSAGESVNLTAELDAALLTRPEELQREIDKIYRRAEHALDRQTVARPVAHAVNRRAPMPSRKPAPPNGNGRAHGPKAAAMTASQRRAITRIADQLELDADAEARHAFGWLPADMSIREASRFIDHLRALQVSGNGRPR